MTTENETVQKNEVKAKKHREAKTFKFNDGEFQIPGKIKWSCCGREVIGYAPLVHKRVMEKFNGNWQEYLDTWTCRACKKAAKAAKKAE